MGGVTFSTKKPILQNFRINKLINQTADIGKRKIIQKITIIVYFIITYSI